MPKSSRHKSSKHSSRDAREYSDSEKDSGVKERSGVRVSKESGEKRKLDSKENKDVLASGNGDYVENSNSSSKRRKDRGDDGVNDRWNGGGGDDDRTIEGSTRKSKASSESKSKKRDENEEQRSKSDGKHRESSRKESREAEREREKERERKGKEGKIERFVESEDHSRASTKQSVVNEKTELNAQDLLPSPESEKQLERRVRRRRDGSGDGDKREVDIGDNNGRHKDDVANDVRLKDEKHKDVRYRDKYREDGDRDSKHRDDKQRDEHPKRDHASSRSDDKHLKDEKDADSKQKKTKVQDSERDREREFDHDHDRDFDSGRDRDRYRERDRDRDYDHDRNRDRIRDRDGDRDRDRDRNKEIERERDLRERDRDRERERERERERNRDRDLDHDRDRDLDHDGSHLDDRKYKGSRGKKRSPDERDDYSDNKSRGIKGHYPDLENKSLSNSRVESDADRGRSQSRQAYVDSNISNRRRTSPSPSSHGGTDDYRHSKQEDKYRDSVTEQRSKAISSRQVSGFSGVTERGSKYRSSERSNKMDDGHLGELPVDRSMSSKASPMGLVERSPSSTSLDLRYINRTGIRRGLDVEETGWRGSVGPRDLSTNEDRLNRDLPLEKPMVDDSSQMDLLYYNRISQGSSSSSLPPPPSFRAGVGSPSFMGSLEDDGRGNISARYRRSGDPNLGRGQGNAWRGPPNWSSPVPNGFIPFQHGPPHGGFQTMMPQFPSPSLFAVRPSMELNHSGIPYHIPDADRFSSHMRPLGWQNMMDGSGPSHLHGWDGNNGGFRDEPHMYGGSDWDQNRHMMNGRGWETSSDMWKGENGDTNMDLPSMSQKEDIPVQAHSDDGLAVKVGQQVDSYENNNHGVLAKSDEPRSISSPAKDSSELPPKTAHEKTSDPSKSSRDDDVAHRCRVYLSKLDISADLAGEGLYSQCMNLLGTYQTATPETETTVIVNLKDGGRAIPKRSKTLLSPPFFPAANDSVFQRAMNYYRKQSIQMSGFLNGGKLDIISKSNEDKEEQGSLCNVDKVEGSVLINDIEMSDAPMSIPDQAKPEALSGDVHEVSEEKVSPPCPVVQDDTHTPPPNVELPNQDFTPKSPEEPVLVFNEDTSMNGLISEQVITEGADGNHSPTLGNATHADAILPADDNKIDEEISNDSFYPPEEKQGLGDAINDPIYLSDGSPKISEAMMPGSNESESVILNRIHHSPESTH